ncbi:MAG: aminoacetone oxidase family FAD-binding enzyme [Thermotogae bacterium]|nr:aminoacetone oxidase family FAD-binding enzyme [Thermotogota bacterium]MCP5465968.1 aminoacetone oxidase family FAD-binding enzyme [Thermotogota bacterium]
MNYDTCIIGAGASGIVAGIESLKNKYRTVIIEKMDSPGKKILATGNGKCNFSNKNMNPNFFHTENKDYAFVENFLKTYDFGFIKNYFENLGILTKTDSAGRAYPFSEQSKTVVENLVNNYTERGGIFSFSEKVISVEKNKDFFIIKTEKNIYKSTKLIISTGGMSYPKLGSDGSMTDIIRNLGHKVNFFRPALVPLESKERYFKNLKGIRIKGNVKLLHNNKIFREEYGEIQFTEYGLSGIVIFNMSRYFNYMKNLKISIDLFPEYSENFIKNFIEKNILYEKNLKYVLNGITNDKISDLIINIYKIRDSEKISGKLKNMEFDNLNPKDFSSSQVSCGGIPLCEISETMESKIIKNLYFTGEILDTDGDCGGYNLHWAWCSGYAAGKDKRSDYNVSKNK